MKCCEFGRQYLILENFLNKSNCFNIHVGAIFLTLYQNSGTVVKITGSGQKFPLYQMYKKIMQNPL
jgi:hypothetical protein